MERLRICRNDSLCPTIDEHGHHRRTAQAGPTSQVPGSRRGAKNAYHILAPLLKDLLGPYVMTWTLVAKLSDDYCKCCRTVFVSVAEQFL